MTIQQMAMLNSGSPRSTLWETEFAICLSGDLGSEMDGQVRCNADAGLLDGHSGAGS
jgi:hypothetical protein